MRKLISTGSPFEEKFAYSRAVVQGDWCFCAGTTGFDYQSMTMPEDPAEQTRNIFETIRRAIDEAGFTFNVDGPRLSEHRWRFQVFDHDANNRVQFINGAHGFHTAGRFADSTAIA